MDDPGPTPLAELKIRRGHLRLPAPTSARGLRRRPGEALQPEEAILVSRDKTTQVLEHEDQVAVLDSAHLGDIRGGLGTIRVDDAGPRTRLSAKVQ